MRCLFAVTAIWMAAMAAAAGQSFDSIRDASAAVVAQDKSRGVFPGTLDQHPAIDYRGGPLSDVVTALQRDLTAGSSALAFEGTQGYLRALLTRLNVPVESQVLLFSKTGIQHPFTTPENPRALYFNDRVIVGYIPGAPLIELASHDPRQGVIFQTLKQDATKPEFARSDRCLSCHLSANSLSVPGILVRSMSTAPDGRPMPQDGSFVIDHRSRLDQRWAGWYVTGAAASVQHLGRTIGPGLDLSAYPLPTSDIAALLVFDHQGHAINLLTRLGWETRYASAEGRLDFTKGDLGDILTEAVDYFLFAGETPMASPVQGDSAFAKSFSAAGPRDHRGRSLRELDLQTRLFKYRCSYMVYSPAFDALPPEARAAMLARLREAITDRATIEILDDTKAGWRS
jgi:hypothetical protein